MRLYSLSRKVIYSFWWIQSSHVPLLCSYSTLRYFITGPRSLMLKHSAILTLTNVRVDHELETPMLLSTCQLMRHLTRVLGRMLFGWGMEMVLRSFLSFNVLFLRLPFSFVLVNSLLSPQTPISTDRFSYANYVVPLSHLFHYIPSHSMMMRPLD